MASEGSLGTIGLGRSRYARRRTDAVGLVWVMSNAASYVLITVGLLDLAWAGGDRRIPIDVGSSWIAGWWALRAGGQWLLGTRNVDHAIALGFAVLACVHVIAAIVLAGFPVVAR